AMLDDAKGQPVFLWLHLFDVHAPYRPHDELVELYYEGDPYDQKFAELPPEVRAKWDKKIRDAAYIRAMYKTEVTYVDGLLKDFHGANPRIEEGVLAFTSDHGESHGEVGEYWNHHAITPFTLHVPLFLAGAGVPPGVVADERVSNVNVGTTLLELAVGESGEFPGMSIASEKGRSRLNAEPRYFLAPSGVAAGIELHPWYLVLRLERVGWSQPPGAPRHGVELYDLRTADDSYVNVAADHPGVAGQLRAALVAWLTAGPKNGGLAGDSPGVGASADIRDLGYAADAKSSIDSALMDPSCGCAQCRKWRQ
ncbi:MAG: sulfatase-like hydrolase/transferase, partial [Planctomycetota bacterium]